MGDSLMIGDFGCIVFFITRRDYSKTQDGKVTYKTIKEPFTFEGMEITDADKSRIWVEGIDKNIPEVFNIRRSQVVSFVKMEKPIIENHEQSDNIENSPVAVASC